MIRGIFVTGTDTGVGKTLVSCLLAEGLVRRGLDVGVLKPYLSGGWDDARALKRAAKSPESLSLIAPVFYAEPLAPMAARSVPRLWSGAAAVQGKKRTPFQAATAAFRELRRRHRFMIVEGIGGALVPLDRRRTAADLAGKFGLPVWIVARAGLGTLNHTLLTLEALRRRGVLTERILLNRYRGNTLAEKTNQSMIETLTGLPVSLLPPVTPSRRSRAADSLARLFLGE